MEELPCPVVTASLNGAAWGHRKTKESGHFGDVVLEDKAETLTPLNIYERRF